MCFNQYFDIVIPSSINTSINKSDAVLEVIKNSIVSESIGEVFLCYPLITNHITFKLEYVLQVLSNSPNRHFEMIVDLRCNTGKLIVKGKVGEHINTIKKLLERHDKGDVHIKEFKIQIPNTYLLEISAQTDSIRYLLNQSYIRLKNEVYTYLIDTKTGSLIKPDYLNFAISMISKYALNPYANNLDRDDETIEDYLLVVNPSNVSLITVLDTLVNQLLQLDDVILFVSITLDNGSDIIFNRKTPKGILSGLNSLVEKELLKPNNIRFNFAMKSDSLVYNYSTKNTVFRDSHHSVNSAVKEMVEVDDSDVYSQSNYIRNVDLPTILDSFRYDLGDYYLELIDGTSIQISGINKLVILAFEEQLESTKLSREEIRAKVEEWYKNN